MGWCDGTEIFDAVVGELVKNGNDGDIDKVKIIKKLVHVLEGMDWDCRDESPYCDLPIVLEACPDWGEGE